MGGFSESRFAALFTLPGNITLPLPMKAEHRHELKTNDLAKSLITVGDYFRVYGGRVALGIAIVILVIVLIKNRTSANRAERVAQANRMAEAREKVKRLTNIQALIMTGRVNPAEFKEIAGDIDKIKEKASDKPMRAEVLALEGDYYWAMANFPDIGKFAGDQKVVMPTEAERREYLKQSQQAYQQVVEQFADQQLPAVTAHMGLASIAENNRDWAGAQKNYESVRDMKDVAPVFKNLAEMKLKLLAEIQKPVLVGVVPEKMEFPMDPLTKPAATSTAPTTSTAPVATKPADTKPADAPKAKDPTTKPATPKKEAPKTKPADAKKPAPTTKPAKPATTQPSK